MVDGNFIRESWAQGGQPLSRDFEEGTKFFSRFGWVLAIWIDFKASEVTGKRDLASTEYQYLISAQDDLWPASQIIVAR